MAGRNKNMAPMWKKLMKNVGLDEPTSFHDHVYLGCSQRECKPNEIIIDEYRKMFESRISAEATENLPLWEKPRAKTVAWSHDMKGHVKKCVERYCELANKKIEQLYKVSTPCLDDHHFKEEEMESVGELSKVCSQIALKCLYLARIGRCDIFPVHQCHVLLCHHCICVHFRRALESQAKRCCHICHHIGFHRLAHSGHSPHWWRSSVIAPFVDPRPAACTHRTAAKRACFFQAVNRIYLRPSDPSLFV